MSEDTEKPASRNFILPTINESCQAALADCGEGYDKAALNAIRLFKAANVIREPFSGDGNGQVATALQTLQMFQIIQRESGPSLRVLDFGGGFALSYFLVRRFIPTLQYRWAVVETPTACGMGRAFETDTLRFFDDVTLAQDWFGGIDAVHSNGVLQYLPSPGDMLDRLLSIGAPHVALLRCVLSNGPDVVQVQETMLSMHYVGQLPAGVVDRTTRFPHTSLSRDVFERKILNSGYRLVASSGTGGYQTDEVSLLHDHHYLYQRSPG